MRKKGAIEERQDPLGAIVTRAADALAREEAIREGRSPKGMKATEEHRRRIYKVLQADPNLALVGIVLETERRRR